MKKKSIIAILILSTLVLAASLQAEVLTLDGKEKKYSLGKHLFILEDREKKLTIDDVTLEGNQALFKKNSEAVPYYGFTDSAYWVRFSIKDESLDSRSWLLDFSYPLMDHISLFLPDGNANFRELKTGYRHSFTTRPLKHRNFIFPLELSRGKETAIYMRFENQDRMEIPLTLWSENAFFSQDHNEQYVMGIYFGILLFMLLFNLLFFLSVRDRTYLYFIFFLFGFTFFQLTQNGYAFEYFTPEFLEPYNHNIPLSITMTLITLLMFAGSFLAVKEHRPILHKIYAGFFIALGLTIPTPLFLKYSTAILIQLIFSLAVITLILYTGIAALLKKYRPAFFFMTAAGTMLLGGIVFSLKIVGFIPSNFYANYSLQVSSILLFALLSFGLGDRVNMLRREREEAKRQALVADERFKLLVDNSDDIVFTMDDDWKFVTVNKAIHRHFKIKPENVRGRHIIDLIYEETEEDAVTKHLIQEKLDMFQEEKEPAVFIAPFMSPIKTEPIEMQVRLEYINIEGKHEILGKASHIQEDSLLKYFRSEIQSFEIGNLLITAEDITHRISRNLSKYLDQRETNMVRIALREMIINAIEHGNLEITYDEKTLAQLEDRYFQLVSERQHDPRFAGRKVVIEYSIGPDKATYTITDEGSGFDYSMFLAENSESANQEMHAHGRGISMAKEIFDELGFNDRGNQAVLVKYFK